MSSKEIIWLLRLVAGLGNWDYKLGMKPVDFVARYSQTQLKESAVAQSHIIDLCALVGLPTPVAAGSSTGVMVTAQYH